MEGLKAVAHLLAEEDVELGGEFVKMPPRTTYPRPVQQPHPLPWAGGVGPGNARSGPPSSASVCSSLRRTLPRSRCGRRLRRAGRNSGSSRSCP
jgi:hypothetical protein